MRETTPPARISEQKASPIHQCSENGYLHSSLPVQKTQARPVGFNKSEMRLRIYKKKEVILRNAAQMTYRCEFESISEFRLMEKRMGGRMRLPAEGGQRGNILAPHQAGTEADSDQRALWWRMIGGSN